MTKHLLSSELVSDSILTDNYTTNRILEIPQNIKFTFVDKVLTIKTGTKVYIPNGFEPDGTTRKFDIKVLTKDYIQTNSFIGTYKSILVSYRSSADTFWHDNALSSFCSGETDALAGSKTHDWYDTKNNKIYHYIGAATTPEGTCSLPVIQMENLGSNGFTKVANIFDCFGYIGSTAFSLPNCTYLFANGRDQNGRFKCIKKTFKDIALTSYGYQTSNVQCLTINTNGKLTRTDRYFVSKEEPSGTDSVWFNPKTNLTYRSDGQGVWYKTNEIVIATEITTNKSQFLITSFSPEFISSLNTLNNDSIAEMSMPSQKYINLTAGSSGSTYVAPANGFFQVKAISTSSAAYCYLENLQGMSNINQTFSANTTISNFIPVKNRDKVYLLFSGVTISYLRFIYAEGST